MVSSDAQPKPSESEDRDDEAGKGATYADGTYTALGDYVFLPDRSIYRDTDAGMA